MPVVEDELDRHLWMLGQRGRFGGLRFVQLLQGALRASRALSASWRAPLAL